MNNSGVETMLCNLLRAWLSNFWNKKCFDLPTRPDTVRFFLVCLFLSLTHDSSYLLTWVSYCCVRTLLRHFAVTDVSPQLHVATENQDTQEWSLRFLLVFFSLFLYCCPAFCIPLCLPVCLGRYVLCLSFRHFLCYFVAFFLPNVAIFLLPAFVLFTPSLLSDVVHLCIIGFFLGTDHLCVLHYFI